MAGAKFNHFNSAVVAGSVGNWKGVLTYTAPSAAAARLPKPRIEGDATASTAPTNRVRVVMGGTGQAGTARNPVAADGANPAGVSAGTGLENLGTIGSGGTVIWEGEVRAYQGQLINTPAGMILAPGVTIQIDVKVGAACNVQAGWDGIEV